MKRFFSMRPLSIKDDWRSIAFLSEAGPASHADLILENVD